MERYTIKRNGDLITLWDVAENMGLQFDINDKLARYKASAVIDDFSIFETEKGHNHFAEIQEQLREYAAQQYPENFQHLK